MSVLEYKYCELFARPCTEGSVQGILHGEERLENLKRLIVSSAPLRWNKVCTMLGLQFSEISIIQGAKVPIRM